MPIFMNYDGIPGDATAAGHEKWIEINSFQFGVGRGISSPTGGSADRESSAPSVSEIVVTKPNDSASTNLFRASLHGEGKTVKIDFCKTDKQKLEVYLSFELENTMISGYSMSSGGDRPSESVSLNFTKITYNNTSMNPTNAADSPDRAFWDLAQASGG
jgi:type VI secretion system secreted protein Hcp